MSYAIYMACVLGAVALFMKMPPRRRTWRVLGTILGAATLGGLWLALAPYWPTAVDGADTGGLGLAGRIYYYIFSAIAIGAAVRVITHRKPVYAALWFVMVVLSSAGLFLLLGAEFMAFAMVIIYGGAILVTYVFVIMLASHAGDPQDADDAPEYDRTAYEPAAAVATGFFFLAVLLSVVTQPMAANGSGYARGLSDDAIRAHILTHRTVEQLHTQLADAPAAQAALAADGPVEQLSNVERVGLDLFQGHPLGLELAGVILLISLVGAVVIARQQMPEQTDTPPAPAPAPGET